MERPGVIFRVHGEMFPDSAGKRSKWPLTIMGVKAGAEVDVEVTVRVSGIVEVLISVMVVGRVVVIVVGRVVQTVGVGERARKQLHWLLILEASEPQFLINLETAVAGTSLLSIPAGWTVMTLFHSS